MDGQQAQQMPVTPAGTISITADGPANVLVAGLAGGTWPSRRAWKARGSRSATRARLPPTRDRDLATRAQVPLDED